MPDARFFDTAPPLSLAKLAERTGARLTRGEPETLIEIAAPLVHADGRGVAFLADPKYRSDLAISRAGAVFLAEKHAALAQAGCAILVTPTPQAAWAMTARALHPARPSPVADLRAEARLEDDVHLGPGVVIGRGVAIGRGTRIGPNTVINMGVTIGDHAVVGAGAVVTKDVPAYAVVAGVPAKQVATVRLGGEGGRPEFDPIS